ncbi:MAG: hypothetical protein PHD95_06000 [Candidatus ainarchaeum sp.]|nr:hypothetical protein [Candidatus ainarchaeum sp.]
MSNIDAKALSLFQDSFLAIKDVSIALSLSYDSAKHCLHRLKNAGRIEQIFRGTYCLNGNAENISFLPCSARIFRDFKFNIPCRIVSKIGFKKQGKIPLRITLRN